MSGDHRYGDAVDSDRVLDRSVRLDSSRTEPGSGLSLGDDQPGLIATLTFPAN